MKKVLLNVAIILLKIIYFPMKLLKIQNKVVYISRQSNSENIDFKLIRQEFEKEYPEYKNVILTKKIEEGLFNKILYITEIVKQMYNIATSKFVILDTYCITACALKHKKETKIIQIWHALGAIKKFGYQAIDKPSGRKADIAKIMHMHENYDYVLAPSKKTAIYFKEAFKVEDNKIIYIGMPRIDYILKEDKVAVDKIYNTYPDLETKTNILYVPTFRKGEKVEIDELIENINTEKYNLIVKLHPLDLKNYEYKERKGVIYENKFGTYDLLKIADKIITDYSSLAMEAVLRDIPIYFYTYDIEKYKQDPGLNFDFTSEEIGKYQTQYTNRLIELLDEKYDYDVLNQFKKKYVDIETKDCTKQIVKFMMRTVENEKNKNVSNELSKEKFTV